jgi:hypothetical protein
VPCTKSGREGKLVRNKILPLSLLQVAVSIGAASSQSRARQNAPDPLGPHVETAVGKATASEEVSAVVAAQRAVHERALMTDPTDIRCMNTVGMHVEFSQSLYFFLISSFLS